jgi:hypothetical protein
MCSQFNILRIGLIILFIYDVHIVVVKGKRLRHLFKRAFCKSLLHCLAKRNQSNAEEKGAFKVRNCF